MLLSVALAGLLAAAASAKIVMVQVGNPAAADAPTKLSFLPDVVMVNPDDTVRFMFMGNHTVTQQETFNMCSPGTPGGATPFDSGIKKKGETFDLPASVMKPGALINYYCKIQQGAHCRAPNFMQGTVVVSGGAAGNAAPGAAAAAAATITVTVGKDGQNQFSPSTIEASAGDSITFMWTGGQKMHNVVPSDQPQSCQRSPRTDTDPILKALASGAPQQSGQHVFKVPATVKPGDELSFFCSVGTHCSAGKMYGSIKIVAPGTARNAVDAPAAGAAAASPVVPSAGAAPPAGGATAAGAATTAGAATDPSTGADPASTAAPSTGSTSGAASVTAATLAVVLPAAAAILRLA